MTKEQIKNLGGEDDRKRLTVTKDYETGEGGGKNYMSIHAELKEKEKMKIGS